jgi:uncharacterized membrane protein
MADYDQNTPVVANPVANAGSKVASSNVLMFAHIIYGIFAFSLIAAASVFGAFVSLVGVVGIVMAHVFKSDAKGTWLESHYDWLIRTFWWSAVWSIVLGTIALVFAITIIGLPIAALIWGVFFLWVAYRLTIGWITLFREKPVG